MGAGNKPASNYQQVITMSEPLCITCKHCITQDPADKTDRFHFHQCRKLMSELPKSVVDGKPLSRMAETTCYAYRYKGLCGTDGKFWEVIPEPPQ